MNASPDVPGVVTAARIRAAVAEREELVGDAPSGAIGELESHAYRVEVEGTDLVLRTRWSRRLPRNARRGSAQLVNDWNRDRVAPTLYTESSDEAIEIVAQQAVSIIPGLTDAQLAEFLDAGLTATRFAFRALAASVPSSS